MKKGLIERITGLAKKAGVEKFDAVFRVKERIELVLVDDDVEPLHADSMWREVPTIFRIGPGLYGGYGFIPSADDRLQDVVFVGEGNNHVPSLSLEDLRVLEEAGVLEIIQSP